MAFNPNQSVDTLIQFTANLNEALCQPPPIPNVNQEVMDTKGETIIALGAKVVELKMEKGYLERKQQRMADHINKQRELLQFMENELGLDSNHKLYDRFKAHKKRLGL